MPGRPGTTTLGADLHPDRFADVVGAEAAVTAWRRHLLQRKTSPANANQALAAVTLLHERDAHLRVQVKRARVPRPGEPDALTPKQRVDPSQLREFLRLLLSNCGRQGSAALKGDDTRHHVGAGRTRPAP